MSLVLKNAQIFILEYFYVIKFEKLSLVTLFMLFFQKRKVNIWHSIFSWQWWSYRVPARHILNNNDLVTHKSWPVDRGCKWINQISY